MKMNVTVSAVFDPIEMTISRKRNDGIVYLYVDRMFELLLSTENASRLYEALGDVLNQDPRSEPYAQSSTN